MKRTNINFKLYLLFGILVTLISIETFAQYGTSRRVARRTSRRTSRRMNYRNDMYYGGGYGYDYGPGAVTTLPGGCLLRAISGINYQYCDGTYYRPYYEGTQVVYVVENPQE